MDRNEYRTRLESLLDRGHQYVSELQKLASDIGTDNADTIEWNLAVDASRLALAANDMIFRALYPRIKSALTDAPELCDADWGSATTSQKCVLPADHDGVHVDRGGHEFGSGGRSLAQVWNESDPALSERLTDA